MKEIFWKKRKYFEKKWENILKERKYFEKKEEIIFETEIVW